MREPTTFDFRNSWWGHALHSPRIEMRRGPQTWWKRLLRRAPASFAYLTCMGHSTPRPREGDILLVPMQSGKTARYEVIDIRWLCDPRDMFDVKRADFRGYEPPAGDA